MSSKEFHTRPCTPPPRRFIHEPESAGVTPIGQSTFILYKTPRTSTRTHLVTPSPSPGTPSNGALLLPRIRRSCQNGIMSTPGTPQRPHVAGRGDHYRDMAAPYPTPPQVFDRTRTVPTSPQAQVCPTCRSPGFHEESWFASNTPLKATPVPHSMSKHSTSPPTQSQSARSISFTAMTDLITNFDIYEADSLPALEEEESRQQASISFELPFRPRILAPELLFASYSEPASSTKLVEYLSGSNPCPSMVQRPEAFHRPDETHFWWDVRNTRVWKFNIEELYKVPGFNELLNQDVPSPALPTPLATHLCPENTAALLNSHNEYYTIKINASLRLSLGECPLVMRICRPNNRPGARQMPDFTSSYEATRSSGERSYPERGAIHVVGLVRSFDIWNTGMRDGSCTAQIGYLRGLAHLQGHMRAYGCRYGFIMTEIELVCIRLDAEAGFGVLDVAAAVKLATHVPSTDSSDTRMTACLALWYLHMLAKSVPLPGHPGWQLNTGGSDHFTRQRCQARDEWLSHITPEGRERRDAKRNRGWIWPEDPLSRREEGPRTRRWRRAMTPATFVTSIR